MVCTTTTQAYPPATYSLNENASSVDRNRGGELASCNVVCDGQKGFPDYSLRERWQRRAIRRMSQPPRGTLNVPIWIPIQQERSRIASIEMG